eukprot:6232740-Pyramimonas_sp.AAC.1
MDGLPTCSSWPMDNTANTVTLLLLENNLPFVRVLIDAPSATSASDVQADLVTSGDGRWFLETTYVGSTVRVALPFGVSSEERVSCKFRKRTQQIEVQIPLSFAAAFSLAAGVGDVNALQSLYGTQTDRVRIP